PSTLISSVPYGKSGPAQRATTPPSRYRAPVPTAPPRQISASRITGTRPAGATRLVDRRAALRPGLGRLEGGGGGQHRVVGVTAARGPPGHRHAPPPGGHPH